MVELSRGGALPWRSRRDGGSDHEREEGNGLAGRLTGIEGCRRETVRRGTVTHSTQLGGEDGRQVSRGNTCVGKARAPNGRKGGVAGERSPPLEGVGKGTSA